MYRRRSPGRSDQPSHLAITHHTIGTSRVTINEVEDDMIVSRDSLLSRNVEDFDKDHDHREKPRTAAIWIKILTACLAWLKFISLGQHTTKLYENGKNKYSSVVGGIATLFLLGVLIFLSTSIMIGCIGRKEWTSHITTQRFTDWEHSQTSKKELSAMGLKFPTFLITMDKSIIAEMPQVLNNWTLISPNSSDFKQI